MALPWVPASLATPGAVVWAVPAIIVVGEPPVCQVAFTVQPVAVLRVPTPPVTGTQWSANADAFMTATPPTAGSTWPAFNPAHMAPVELSATSWSAIATDPYLSVGSVASSTNWAAPVPSVAVGVPPAAQAGWQALAAVSLTVPAGAAGTQWAAPAPVAPPFSRVGFGTPVPAVSLSAASGSGCDFDAPTPAPALRVTAPAAISGWVGRAYVGKTEVPPAAQVAWTSDAPDPEFHVGVSASQVAFVAPAVNPAMYMDVVEACIEVEAVSPGAVYLGAGHCDGSWTVAAGTPTPVLWFVYPTAVQIGATVTVFGQGASGTNGMSIAGLAATDVTYTQVPASGDAYTEDRRIDTLNTSVNVEHDMVSGTVPAVNPPGGRVCVTY